MDIMGATPYIVGMLVLLLLVHFVVVRPVQDKQDESAGRIVKAVKEAGRR